MHKPSEPFFDPDLDDREVRAAFRQLDDQPPAALDAAILAAAHEAVAANARNKVVALPQRRRWLAPVGLAASLLLAVGIVFQLDFQPRPETSAMEPLPQAVEETAALPAPAQEAPPPAEAAAAPQRGLALPAPQADRKAVASDKAKVAETRSLNSQAEAPSAVMADQAAPPAAPLVESAPAPAPAAPPPPAAPSPALKKLEAPASRAAERVNAAGSEAAKPALADTASVPEPFEAAVETIRRLLREQRPAEARTALQQLRRAYPDRALPADLQVLAKALESDEQKP
ncbi:hypothetical protein [Chitinimonas lacunae]|uniref:Tetratricopeptide repeat protein n=1 Tax=Chitinimonas lacunae TaxID=1963018 RepID=A0ABV8MV97_9NEIS